MRQRARYVGFTVTGAALIVGGIVGALVSTRAESRISGVAVLAFGAALLAAGRMSAPGRARVPPRTIRTEVDGRAVAAVELEMGRDRLWAAVAGSAGFVVAGVAIALSGALVVGLLSAFVFGVFAVLGALKLAGGATYLLTETDVVSRSGAGEMAIAWDDVAGVAETRVRGTRFATVTARESSAVRATRGSRLVNRVTRASLGDLSIPLDLVDVDPETLLDAMARLAEDPAARRRISTGELGRELGADANLTPASPV